MVPGAYLHEGGQTAAGQLLDFCVGGAFYAGAAAELAATAAKREESPYAVLNGRLDAAAARRGCGDVAYLARDVHVDPDFFGNRAPLADPTRRGAVVGLRLSETADDLAALYLAAVQALAYQTRHIAETLTDAGHEPFQRVVLTGGMAKNPLFVKTLADALNVPVALPREAEAVLLGAAVLAAAAAGAYDGVAAAMRGMTGTGALVRPDPCPKLRRFHDAKYAAFREIQKAQTEATRLMAAAE